MKAIVLLLALTIISFFSACNITDTDAGDMELQNTLTCEQKAIFSKGAGPNNPGQGEFFPLATGNSWTYTGERSMSIGDGESYYATVQEQRSIEGTEELFGREYFLEKQTSTISSGTVHADTVWYRYRQDRAGLYEADVSVTDPPGEGSYEAVPAGEVMSPDRDWWCILWQRSVSELESVDKVTIERARIAHFRKIDAVNELLGRGNGPASVAGPPGGILPDEIQRLEYPLHPGQEWVIRDSPLLFYSVVEKKEVLDLPAGRINGWRIRVYNELLGDSDIVYLWYGRTGFLGMTVHLETTLDGMYEVMVSDENLFLESYALADKNIKREKAEDEKGTGSKRCDLTIR